MFELSLAAAALLFTVFSLPLAGIALLAATFVRPLPARAAVAWLAWLAAFQLLTDGLVVGAGLAALSLTAGAAGLYQAARQHAVGKTFAGTAAGLLLFLTVALVAAGIDCELVQGVVSLAAAGALLTVVWRRHRRTVASALTVLTVTAGAVLFEDTTALFVLAVLLAVVVALLPETPDTRQDDRADTGVPSGR